ncbi:Cleavage and polyadenylation specificity factor subunit 3 [Chytriomyces hyalinus]|nr:Cleavage and polyadenylation specificity factor subunit 3 [Chytriomyces hyalinus]
MKRRQTPSVPSTETNTVRDANDIMRITPLGAGQEVGRSCIMLEFKSKTIMLDCGLHPAHSGLAALPFFDNIDPASIDVLLITHFHIDHAAALPYFMEKTTFRGRVFMTHPTKAIFKWLLADYVKVSSLAVDDQLYDEKDLLRAFDKIEAVDFHQLVDIDGIKFTAYNAGHVLGAAMFLIEIAGVRVLYTGDYSREEDRHLMAAERPPNITPEVLISESTYGVQTHQSRVERETQFTKTVHKIVSRGGRCLIPVFALGRAQELLLILDEYWQLHPELHPVPIYYASALAKKCMTVYQTFSNMMNARIRAQTSSGHNPFHFKHISNLKSMNYFDDVGACVMMASPGMLQNGQSRELLERWCTDSRNGVLIPGYVVDGTLGHDIVNNKVDTIPAMSGGPKLPLNLLVEYVSFSAHVDFAQNSQFIEELGSPNLVLVHGAATEMGRLKSALTSRYHESDRQLNIYTPKNCEAVELYFKGERMAKAIGTLAKTALTNNMRVEGVLVSHDFTYRLIDPSDLPEFTDLVSASLTQRLVVSSRAPLSLVKWHLEGMYGTLGKDADDDDAFFVFNTVKVKDLGTHRLVLEWEGNSVNDMVADSVLAIILQAESSPASVKATKSTHVHAHEHEGHNHESAGDDDASLEPAAKKPATIPDESGDGSETEFEETVTDYFRQQFGVDGVELEHTSGNGTISTDEGESMDELPNATDSAEANEDQELRKRRCAWKVKVDGNVAGIVLQRGKMPVELPSTWNMLTAMYSLNLDSQQIESSSDELHRRVTLIANRVKKTLDPIGDTWNPSS